MSVAGGGVRRRVASRATLACAIVALATVALVGGAHVAPATAGTSSAMASWESLGGRATADPAIVAGPDGVDAFVRGGDGAIYWNHRSGANWSGWQGLGGYSAWAPTAVADPSGSSGTAGVLLFVVGGDLGVYWQRRSGGSWSGWQPLGGAAYSAIAAVTDPSGVHIAVTGGLDYVYEQRLAGESWSGWDAVPLARANFAGFVVGLRRVSLASDAGGVHLSWWSDFEVAPGGPAYPAWNKWTSGAWDPNGCFTYAGVTITPVATTGPSGLELLVRGGDGALYETAEDLLCPDHPVYKVELSWNRLGGFIRPLTAPAVLTRDTRTDVFIRGGDGGIYVKTRNPAWGTWQSLDAPAGGVSTPAVARDGDAIYVLTESAAGIDVATIDAP